MKGRISGWLSWVIFLTSVGLTLGAAVFAWINEQAGTGEFSPLDLLWGLSWLALPAVGAIVASRRPENPVGWLACSFALPIALMLFTNEYARQALVGKPGSLPGGPFMLWLSQWPFFVAGGIGVSTLLLFPEGRLPSRHWRIAVWLAVAASAIGAVAASFGSVHEGHAGFENPLLIRGLEGPLETVQGLAGNALGALLVLSFLSIILRYRRAGREERLQLKWFLYGFAFLLMVWLLLFVLEGLLGEVPETLDTILFVIGGLGLPIGFAVAILRYRLYDIDVVINKTVVYVGLAGFITAIYVVVVVGVGSLVGAGGEPNLGLSLAATGIVAVAFQPVRERVQRFANKLVYGERVTPYEAVTSFSHRMAESLSLDQVLPQMAEAAAKGVAGNRSQVKLFLPGGGERVVTWPTISSGNSFDRTISVSYQGERVGEIAVAKAPGEQMNKNEERLLGDLASQAGLAMRNLRLTGELQQKLLEVQESRKRVVAAQDLERRRMEREIQEGAQRQLISMAAKLAMAKSLVITNEARGAVVIDELRADAGEAVESVRDLARGIFPKILSDRGLAEAVDAHLARTGIDARLESGIGDARFDPEVEAGVYFVIREALRNVAKHAPGYKVSVAFEARDTELSFRVSDRGPGFDFSKGRMGSGFQNMVDRIEALGGKLEVESSPGAGTTIVGSVSAGGTRSR